MNNLCVDLLVIVLVLFLGKEVFSLMVVSYEESALILKIKMCRKTCCGNLVYNFLLYLFIEYSSAFVSQFLHVM